jgi:Caspase domain
MPEKRLGQKLAVILTVSAYNNLSALPGCENDGIGMKRLLEAADKYDEIYENPASDSASVKNLLRSIHAKYRGTEVDEIFFYFSGHGTVVDEDFFYCSKDFNENNPSSSGIVNREVDTIFRELSPKTFVKVIDACHSGFKLIKEAISLDKALQLPAFKDYICFCSSMEDQSSFATKDMSYFTKEFIIGASSVKTDQVLYIDIQSHLLDAFRNNPKQHPYFITQWQGTQIFCENSSRVKGMAEKIFRDLKDQGRVPTAPKAVALLEAVKKRDANYVSLEAANAAAKDFFDDLAEYKLGDELAALYEVRLQYNEPYEKLPSVNELAKLFDRASVAEDMVEISWAPMRRRLKRAFDLPGMRDEFETVLAAKEIKPKADIKIPWVLLEARPRFVSLPWVGLAIVPIPRRTGCRVFSSVLEYRRDGWDKFTPTNKAKWEGQDYKWMDLKLAASSLVPRLEAEVSAKVASLLGPEKLVPSENLQEITTKS